jgi:prepilin-type N-terminal cleavage/methylation domain-containing protein
MKLMKRVVNGGFTLVELLIVIALIAILSVAVLATINPIEQSNKARDARVQNDAAEVLNGYERYYASNNKYPWMDYAIGSAEATPYTLSDGVLLRSDTYGFGICSGAADVPTLLAGDAKAVAADCTASDDIPNLLISTSELKGSFAGKDEFLPVQNTSHPEQGLWLSKAPDDNSIYVCYIPKAGANRILAGADWSLKMRCLDTVTGTMSRPTVGAVVGCGSVAVTDWSTPSIAGTQAMFRCVPE